ncbi:carbohydrate-responsive element-binding protein-like [Culicoides brevitarsis]|uniref:carbohydrate-responsive element-binding protein-like n=1 Tax=Culicoides brevitarsis TaxID=469753 RepID=UPI00307C2934
MYNNNNYGSEKVLNCHNFGSNWYQQEPNVNSWLDFNNYPDNNSYFNSGQSNKTHDFVLNFDENHAQYNNLTNNYQQSQAQSNVTEFNCDMRYNTRQASHIAPITTTTHDNVHESQRLSGNFVGSQQFSNDFYQVPLVSPVSSDRSSISEASSRVTHIYAEKKRRQNIKQGFDALRGLIGGTNGGYKISNARLLTRSRDHIKNLKNERSTNEQKIKALQMELKSLNASISNIQETLPMMGATFDEKPKTAADFFAAYLKAETQKNWKFWIFAKICQPVVQAIVAGDTKNPEMRQVGEIVEEKCPMIKMRLAASNMLREVSLNTDLLMEKDAKLDEEIRKLVQKEQ